MNQIIPWPRFLIVFLLLSAVLISKPVLGQETPFDLAAYESFLNANSSLSASGLLGMYPAGDFRLETSSPFRTAFYSDSVRIKMGITPAEEKLGNAHGFFVTERLTFDSFGTAFREVYTKDLPVFISTDAILHAIHMSYDFILMDTESLVLEPKLRELLAGMHDAVPALQARYAGIPEMEQPLRDLDVYLTIPRTLLSTSAVAPVFSENSDTVGDLLDLIEAEQGGQYNLFAETCRLLDFSQFTVRGHYTQREELARYFQAMMWLGRTEIYLSIPQTDTCRPTEDDVQRQTILALLAREALEEAGAEDVFTEIEELIQLFVGESDNVTLSNLTELRTLTSVDEASDLLDANQLGLFQETLSEQAWSIQRIQSQMLVNNTPMEPGRLQPAAAFMLFGQRFVIDSYVTSSVVYDRIDHNGSAVRRMLPKPLDVLFALGNDAAAQLLEPELEQFHYGPNMAALRYLVDSYEDEFWQQSLYNGWLNTIRSLNPPEEAGREGLPAFMQTAAWWQEKMNTQLAGWAQLRHDNLLYAKQSYTGIPGCSFPFSYVEPIPAFYEAVGTFARTAAQKFSALPTDGALEVDGITDYFEYLAGVNDTLAVVAQKELDGRPFNEEESTFLRRVIYFKDMVCYQGLDGWYARLFYGDEAAVEKPDMVVADIHTSPADESGNLVGWVLHVGTGPVNMAVVTANVPGEGEVAFVGPVMSYYEHLSTGFERLTDEVWQTSFSAAPSRRPEFVNAYLADSQGEAYEESMILSVSNEDPGFDDPLPTAPTAARNFPNPFSDWTNITFSVPSSSSYQPVELLIYDSNGRLVDQLVSETLASGHYSVRWDGILPAGNQVASGVYYARLKVGDVVKTTPMARVR